MLTTFTLMDSTGQKWTIPAEVISTKFPAYRFVVHKSLGLDDSSWVVSHFNTGGRVGSGATKQLAIEAAHACLDQNKLSDLKFAIEECYRMAAEIVTGQQIKRASSQNTAVAKAKKKPAAEATRASRPHQPPVLSVVPSYAVAA